MNDEENEYRLAIAIATIKDLIKELQYCRTYGIFADERVIQKSIKMIEFLEDKQIIG
jgi:hypothetical protein